MKSKRNPKECDHVESFLRCAGNFAVRKCPDCGLIAKFRNGEFEGDNIEKLLENFQN